MRFSQSKGRFSRNLLAAAILTPTLVLTGCFFDDDDDDKPGSGGSTSSSAGLAYDGYLIGATVCIDLNLNKTCDASDPSSTTDANGNFNITGLTATQAKYPLVLESTADTEDSDNPGVKVGTGLKFLAPAGSKTVSAYSTIIQAKIQAKLAGGDTRALAQLKAEAATELSTTLGLGGVDLTDYDPIATKTGSGAEADKITAAKIHLMNQILSNELLTNLPNIITQAQGAGVTPGAAASLLAEKLESVIATIKSEVDTATSGLADAAAISALDESNVTISVLPISVTNAELQAQQTDEDAANEAIEDELGDAGDGGSTGGTGATGGSGGVI